MSAFIGLDLYILNEGMVKAGYFKSQYIANGISNDGLSVAGNEGQLLLPCEIYTHPTQKLTFFMLRSGSTEKRQKHFMDDLTTWAKSVGISQVLIFSACVNPVRAERDSNRL